MHFHLPRPLHGWREFAGEVGIIVIGVLIALGAEQVVEKFHWDHEINAERASLLQEATDMDSAIKARADQQPCIDRRLAEIRVVLERHKRSQPLGLTGALGAPTGQSASRGTWQIALAGQALAHMSHDEKLAFSSAFGDFDLWDRAMRAEADAWLQMAPLNYPELLGDADWASIIKGYSAAMIANEHMRVLAPWMLDQDREQLPAIARYRPAGDLRKFHNVVERICRPVLTTSA
jgi:hypothetical protein